MLSSSVVGGLAVLVVALVVQQCFSLSCRKLDFCDLPRDSAYIGSKCENNEMTETCTGVNQACQWSVSRDSSGVSLSGPADTYEKKCVPSAQCNSVIQAGFCSSISSSNVCVKCCTTDNCNNGTISQGDASAGACSLLNIMGNCSLAWQCFESECSGSSQRADAFSLGKATCGLQVPSSEYKSNVSLCSFGAIFKLREDHNNSCNSETFERQVGLNSAACLMDGGAICNLPCEEVWSLVRSLYWKQSGEPSLAQIEGMYTAFIGMFALCNSTATGRKLYTGTCLPFKFYLVNISADPSQSASVKEKAATLPGVSAMAKNVNALLNRQLGLAAKNLNSLSVPLPFLSPDSDGDFSDLSTAGKVSLSILVMVTSRGNLQGGYSFAEIADVDLTSELKTLTESRPDSSTDYSYAIAVGGTNYRYQLAASRQCATPSCSTAASTSPGSGDTSKNTAASIYSLSLFTVLLITLLSVAFF